MSSDSIERQSTPCTPRQMLANRLRHLLDRLPDAAVNEALSADDIGTFAALASPSHWQSASLSAVDKARLRGVAYRQTLLDWAGGSLSVDAVADMLGVSGEAVRKRIRRQRLIGIRTPRGYGVPAVQFDQGQEIPGLSQALAALSLDSPWMRLEWLMSPEIRLDDQAPMDALRSGVELERIVGAATTFGEHGAA